MKSGKEENLEENKNKFKLNKLILYVYSDLLYMFIYVM